MRNLPAKVGGFPELWCCEEGGFPELWCCEEVCPAHDSYFRSTIGRDGATAPDARYGVSVHLMGVLGD
jgi:hypothetical protein